MSPSFFINWSLVLIMLAIQVTPIRPDANYYRLNEASWNRYFDAIVVDVPNYNDQNGGSTSVVDSADIPSGMKPSGVHPSYCHYIGYYYNPPHYNARFRERSSAEYKYPPATYNSFMIREEGPNSRVIIGYRAS